MPIPKEGLKNYPEFGENRLFEWFLKYVSLLYSLKVCGIQLPVRLIGFLKS